MEDASAKNPARLPLQAKKEPDFTVHMKSALFLLYFHDDWQNHRTSFCLLPDIIFQRILNDTLDIIPACNILFLAFQQRIQHTGARLIHQIQAENGVRLHLEHLQDQNKTALEAGGVCDQNSAAYLVRGTVIALRRNDAERIEVLP